MEGRRGSWADVKGRTLTGAGATADGVEEEEALEAGAVVRELADAVEHEVDNLLADRVVATRVVVGGVLLARDELLGVVELAVRARADLVCRGRGGGGACELRGGRGERRGTRR